VRRKGLATLVQRAAHDSRSESRDAQRLKSLLELVELKSVADALQLKPLLEQAQLKPAVGAAPLNPRPELAWLKSVVVAAQLKYGLLRKERVGAAGVAQVDDPARSPSRGRGPGKTARVRAFLGIRAWMARIANGESLRMRGVCRKSAKHCHAG